MGLLWVFFCWVVLVWFVWVFLLRVQGAAMPNCWGWGCCCERPREPQNPPSQSSDGEPLPWPPARSSSSSPSWYSVEEKEGEGNKGKGKGGKEKGNGERKARRKGETNLFSAEPHITPQWLQADQNPSSPLSGGFTEQDQRTLQVGGAHRDRRVQPRAPHSTMQPYG